MSLTFFDLPIIVQETIFKCFSHAELSRLRSVNKHFHRLCSQELNRNYFQLEILIHELQKQIKIQLPRRESERHKHPLSTKYDIISSLDSRIQWLKLTFGSSIQNSLCCFYPGRLLDEIYSVIRHLKTQETFSNPRTLLQETRDMSSMAIEHFREQIEPKLQQTRFTSLTVLRNNLSTFCPTTSTTTTAIATTTRSSRKHSGNIQLRRQISSLNNRLYKQNLVIQSQNFQMKFYKKLLSIRTKALNHHHKRLKYLEKKSHDTEQILDEIRKDNHTLVQRFDQFVATNQLNTKRRKID